jgi:hypothetical protein
MNFDDFMMLTILVGLALSCVHFLLGFKSWQRAVKREQRERSTLQKLYEHRSGKADNNPPHGTGG